MLRFLVFAAFLLSISAPAAQAAEWPSKAKAEMKIAGDKLQAAKTTADRVAALRQIEKIAAANPNADQARLTARLMSVAAAQEAGPARMLEALGNLAAAGAIKDARTFRSIVGPMMATIGEMRDNGMLLPDTAVRVDNAIKKLDDAATKAGLPKLADIVDPPIGGTQPRSKTAELIEQIAALAKKARDAANPQNMNEAEKRRAIDRLFGLLPRGAGPALTGPGYTVFRDTVVWNSEMFDESSKAMNLVADAMTTGKFDQQTFGKIESRMKDLAKGPWTEKTAVDFFERLCKGIPVAGPWCGEAFKLFKAKSSDVDCAAISCDCDNVPGGLMKGPLIVQCRIRQQDLIAACQSEKKVLGSCAPEARGPRANAK